MNEYHFYKIFLLLLAIVLTAFMLEICSIKGYTGKPTKLSNWPTMIMILMLLIILLFPFDVLNRPFRYEFILVTLRNLAAPFLEV
jgi:hypothetical protein